MLASAVSLGCLLLLVREPSLVRYLNDKAFDALAATAPNHPTTSQTVIVDIDNASLANIGRWPWNRDVLAHLVEKLNAQGASVIALDVMFPEPSSPANDQQLAQALRASRSVLGYDFVFDGQAGTPLPCPTPPRPLIASDVLSVHQVGALLPVATSLVCNIPELAASATQSGFMNTLRDADGKIRRAPLMVDYAGALYPSLALATLLARNGIGSLVIEHKSDRSWLRLGKLRLGLVDGASFLLHYRGKGHTMPYVSALDVLRNRTRLRQFAGSVVVIGSSAQGIEPSVASPADPAFPGVEVQATAIDNLLLGDYFYRPEWGSGLELLEVAILAFVSAWLLFRWPPRWAVLAPFVLAICVWLLSGMLLQSANIFVAPVVPLIAATTVLVSFALMAIFQHDKARRKASADMVMVNRFITGALGALTRLRDVETGQHVIRIQAYLRSLCQVAAKRPRFARYLTPAMIDLLVQLAPIHDIGKVGVPDYILRKPGELTPDEFNLMKSHVSLGRKLLQDAREHSGLRNEIFFQTATDLVYSHHERWDGTGYPQGLKGDQIPIPGRLLAVADVYDALISKRHYKTELLHVEAVERIRRGAGTHFDPEIVDCFLQVQDDWRRMAEAHRDNPGQVASAHK